MTEHVTRRRHDATGRSTGRFADPRFRKLNKPPPGEPWLWLTREILESYAWRALSNAGQKTVSRIGLEHLAHGGCLNGDLPVTYRDFEAYGIGPNSVFPALAEASALGLIERTVAGHQAWGPFKGRPARYGLCWLPRHDGTPASNRWRRFHSLAEARGAAAEARQRVADDRQRKCGDHDEIDLGLDKIGHVVGR
jgi:hypothetical protein